eukprot:GHUV01053499.1.p2 GENE.GHUV01053499.1~~GHUV01053499.1.p2  ORF type:complete len:102 (-),score=49.52 GHUV01053499.1:102-407(-)
MYSTVHRRVYGHLHAAAAAAEFVLHTATCPQVGCLDARGVQPVQGNVMVFPHGGTVGSLVHEGSAVLEGAKYVIRTDVLYMKAENTGRRGQQQQQQQQKQQ